MFSELPEKNAQGPIAEIYRQIRLYWGVPYVSSLQRHLASKPGWLEWAWPLLSPAFKSGRAQNISWGLAKKVELPPLPTASNEKLLRMGVNFHDQRVIKEICASFVRVAPVNLIFAGLLRCLLSGEQPHGLGWPEDSWQLPKILPPLPDMVNVTALDNASKSSLHEFGIEINGQIFVPGLYRLLARWPRFLIYLEKKLTPQISTPEYNHARDSLLSGIDVAVPGVFAELPVVEFKDPPNLQEIESILAALDAYRRTSPEMVIFGRLIASTLP